MPSAQQYFDFLETIPMGLPKDVHVAVRQRLWFQHSEVHMQHIQQGQLDLEGQLYVFLSGTGSNLGRLLPVGIPEAAHLCSPFQDY
jgi:hypothetical protein